MSESFQTPIGGATRFCAVYGDPVKHSASPAFQNASKATAVTAEIQTRFSKTRVNVGYPRPAVDLVLNATALGLTSEDPLPMDEQAFPLREARWLAPEHYVTLL